MSRDYDRERERDDTPQPPPLMLTPRGRSWLIGVLTPLMALVLAGCVDLPTNSGVIKDTSQPTANGGEDVRIWPNANGPSNSDSPLTVLEGFLQTAASDQPDPEAAQLYLTGQARKDWDPNKVVVLSSENSAARVRDQDNGYEIKATKVGEVDNGRYTAVANPTSSEYYFHLSGDAKTGYRIDTVPTGFGIPLTQEAFHSYYTPYNAYYVNQSAPDSMISVPVYLRTALQQDVEVAKQLTDIVLGSPPPQYDGVAVAAATKVQPASVTITQADAAQVTLKQQNLCTPTSFAPCKILAEELLASFVGIGTITSVDVFDQALGPQVHLGHADNVQSVMQKYHVTINAQNPSRPADYYFIDPPGAKNDANAGRVMVKTEGKNSGTAVQVGPASLKYGQLAYGAAGPSRQPTFALTDVNGTKLYLGTPNSSAPPTTVYTGSGIQSLSWDAFGHLWFIATADGQPTLYRVDTNVTGTPQYQQVIVDLPPTGTAIQQVSAAPDGRRIAVVYKEQGGTVALSIGVELPLGPGQYLVLSGGVGQAIVGGWFAIFDVEWNSSQTLAIFGAPQNNVSATISEVFADGSPVFTVTDLNAVTIVPPINTTSIAWTATGGLLAAYQNKDGSLAIDSYVASTGNWGVNPIPGISPSYGY